MIYPCEILKMISLVAGILVEVSKIFIQDSRFDVQPQMNPFLVNTYRKLIRRLHLAGYGRHQYSDYLRLRPNSNPVAVWTVMVQLCQIQPPGKLQSTLLGLKMHYIHHLNDMDVTNQLQLGGAFSTTLAGPTPQALVAQVPPGLLNPPPVIPGAGFVRPVHTRPSAMADNPNNYRS